MSFTSLFVFIFLGTVMDSVPISLKDPLMLAYYILDNCSSQGLVTPLLDNSFIHTAVHQLRCLEIFLKFNEVSESEVILITFSKIACPSKHVH